MKTKPSDRIRQLRQQRGLSQENMADMLALSTTAYGDIERGKTDLTLTRLAQIADVLHVSVTDLLTDNVVAAVEAQPVATEPYRIETLQLMVEKQQLEIDKLRLEADAWKRRYEERLVADFARTVASSATTLPDNPRERIGFK